MRVPPIALLFPALLATPQSTAAQAPQSIVLRPERVFDAVARNAHTGWEVVVLGDRIASAGPAGRASVPAEARIVELPGTTLLPGLIEGHSHLGPLAPSAPPL
jgi:imidazolonepropionase-like amidohydrolase